MNIATKIALILIVVAIISSLVAYSYFSLSAKPTPYTTIRILTVEKTITQTQFVTLTFTTTQIVTIVPSPSTVVTSTTTSPIQTAFTQRQEAQYIEVVDVLNRSVKIPKNLSRIVAIGPGALRLVAYLNATNLLVGVEQSELQWGCIGRDYAMAYCSTIQRLPVIGPGGPRNPPNPEMLMQVKPQLIVMYRGYVNLYPPDRLEAEVGVPVLVIDYGTAGYVDIGFLEKALRLLGKALNRDERAQQLISYIDSVVQDLSNRVKSVREKPTIYIGAISYTGAQPFTASQSMFAPLVLLNTSSIVDNLKPVGGYIQVDFEYLLKKQPDYIFIDENNLNMVLDDFSKNRDQYCSLNAFKEGRIFGVLPFNYYHTNIATAFADAYFIGKVLYPGAFADVDPIQKADEIFKAFVGKPLYQDFVKNGYQGFVNLSNLFKCG
jgi:iron complex transport system substrate-binding protein